VKTIYLALGSNIGDREAHLRAAIDNLATAGITILRESPIYETQPVGLADQRWFFNMVLEAETSLFPMQLLLRIGKIERLLGRVRTIANGPRTIDIDILLYANAAIRAPRLQIPHPRMHERRFVLTPLADLVPALRHPGTRKTVAQMLSEAPAEVVRKVG
jgi:2-amino-4-hydroxy-6-hydroxymethyldihydropteridine diphosphokinase